MHNNSDMKKEVRAAMGIIHHTSCNIIQYNLEMQPKRIDLPQKHNFFMDSSNSVGLTMAYCLVVNRPR